MTNLQPTLFLHSKQYQLKMGINCLKKWHSAIVLLRLSGTLLLSAAVFKKQAIVIKDQQH
jgi:hypothetical protein